MTDKARFFWQVAGTFSNEAARLQSRFGPLRPSWTCPRCLRRRAPTLRRFASSDAGGGSFRSIVDDEPQLVRLERKHGRGLIVLALIPVTAFALGTWQVQRLSWKTELIARFEDRLVREPLPLPLYVDPNVIQDFDYRRVYATGRLRHDQEMLVGPRIHDGENGFFVVTPLEREEVDGKGTRHVNKILVCRGWISKRLADKRERLKADAGGQRALPQENVTVQGLLREPWKKNYFTPANHPEKNEWYFMDIKEMAEYSGSQPVWIEETMQPDLIEELERLRKGIPIGRAAEVNLRNNHLQYIFTWYGLAVATTIMFGMVIRRGPSGLQKRVRHSKEW